MNEKVRELAAKHGAALVDFHSAIWDVIRRVRAMKTGERELEDFIHPNALGHAAMARQFCHDVGEPEMERWLDAEVERLFAERARQWINGPALACRLVFDPKRNPPSALELSYEIPWTVVGTERAVVSLELPDGWCGDAGTLTPSTGVARVTGTPDRLANPVRLMAKNGGRTFSQAVEIPAPWKVSGGFEFAAAWKDRIWQADAVCPVAPESICDWSLYTGTYDFAGGTDSGAVDVRAFELGRHCSANYLCRRIYAPRELELDAVVGTTFWSARMGVTAWIDGERVLACSLVSVPGKTSAQTQTFKVKLTPGWHELRILHSNFEWDDYFHFRLLDPATGKDPADLRVNW